MEGQGVDITRRCWAEKCDGTAPSKETLSGDETIFDVKEAGVGRDMGAGRRLLARSAVTI